jgi:hypothetical protein
MMRISNLMHIDFTESLIKKSPLLCYHTLDCEHVKSQMITEPHKIGGWFELQTRRKYPFWKRLFLLKYSLSKSSNLQSTSIWSSIIPEHTICSICLSDYEEGELLRQLPCQHHFHQICIDHWIHLHPRCPLCKYTLNGV